MFNITVFVYLDDKFNSLIVSVDFWVLLLYHWFLGSAGAQNFQAPPKDLAHPHGVHDVEAEAAEDPGTASPRSESVEGLGAVHTVHLAVVDWNDRDPHQEKGKGHGYSINKAGVGKLVVAQNLKKPPEIISCGQY